MTERDALYRAILQHPDDDTPRLIFADWLDENDEPERAEFVRVQCRLADPCTACGGEGEYDADHRPGKMECRLCFGRKTFNGPEVDELRSRERALFTAHGKEWFGDDARLPGVSPGGTVRLPYTNVARGFPSHWYGPWNRWIDGTFCEAVQGSAGMYDSCDCGKCGGDGRIHGACDTIAWRPEWTMECENCGGFGEFRRRHDNGDGPAGPCPDCGGKWNSGPHYDTDDYWDAGSGRVPRPCPLGAVPLMDVTLADVPFLVVGNTTASISGLIHEERLTNPGTAPSEAESCQIRKRIFAAEWPGLRFHLPSERNDFANYVQALRDDIMDSLGIPPAAIR